MNWQLGAEIVREFTNKYKDKERNTRVQEGSKRADPREKQNSQFTYKKILIWRIPRFQPN